MVGFSHEISQAIPLLYPRGGEHFSLQPRGLAKDAPWIQLRFFAAQIVWVNQVTKPRNQQNTALCLYIP